MNKKLVWKEHRGIRYSDSGQGFFWLKFPSGIRGKFKSEDESNVIKEIDRLAGE